MTFNPFYLYAFLALVLYIYNHLRKMRLLLPGEFTEMETQYIPTIFQSDYTTTWYERKEIQAKMARKILPKVFLGGILLFSLPYLLNFEASIILDIMKYAIIAVFGIAYPIMQIFYRVKVYQKYINLCKSNELETQNQVLKFTILQCLAFLLQSIIIIFLANNPRTFRRSPLGIR
ncbi:hypothetical protein Amet_1336 [Alkaliphilus metalliredigens QYMF]|uniref:Uncharacterized protein n=1 Tax=Alkaliphilus metalliredigens (strain QYMF) TaxID=293826 RepID=A6TMX0_ALKMQ|nr:hypothetical protein [Alkaliphilus metalliredigens]ABR47538.1 hypothetical protein Amet_1336 [Alkaliphilus metalliredigens QYMF]